MLKNEMESYVRIGGEGFGKSYVLLHRGRGIQNCKNHPYVINEWPLRQMPGDLCTAPRIISLSPLSLAIDVTDATHGASGLRLGTRTGAGDAATLTESFFWLQPMAPWTAGYLFT